MSVMTGCAWIAEQSATSVNEAIKTQRDAASASKANINRSLMLVLEFNYFFATSTAYTCVAPCIFERNTIHFISGVNVTFGSNW